MFSSILASLPKHCLFLLYIIAESAVKTLEGSWKVKPKYFSSPLVAVCGTNHKSSFNLVLIGKEVSHLLSCICFFPPVLYETHFHVKCIEFQIQTPASPVVLSELARVSP